MCLGPLVRWPDHLLARGEHLGYRWIVMRNDRGYRCGYVRVDPGHPWHGKAADEVDASAHDGLNFAEPDVPCDGDAPDDGYWLGFDCYWGGDARDPALMPPRIAFALAAVGALDGGGVIRTTAYVEAECRSLCEQAAEAALR